jgi:hypothetical protein
MFMALWDWTGNLRATMRTKAERAADFEILKDEPRLAADRAKVVSMRQRADTEALAPIERRQLWADTQKLEAKFGIRDLLIAEARSRLGRHPIAAEKPLQRRKRQVASLLRNVRWQLEKSAGRAAGSYRARGYASGNLPANQAIPRAGGSPSSRDDCGGHYCVRERNNDNGRGKPDRGVLARAARGDPPLGP